MATRSKHADKGKAAEKEAFKWLEERSQASTNFAWHRFPDAHAARGALAAQPSDALVVVEGDVIFLEVKETAEVNRLPRSKITQYGALKKFVWAGAMVCVLVRRTAYSDWVVFNDTELFPVDGDTPTSFPFGNKRSFITAADALEAWLG